MPDNAATSSSPRIFYGWWVVISCLLMSLLTAGLVHFGFTAVLQPISNEFGWSYALVSGAASLRGLEQGLFAPLIGFITDRWGPRKLMVTGAIVCGAGMIVLSRVNSLATFYASFVLIALGTSCSTSTVTITAVGNWFRRKLAMATGITVSGFALGGLVVPLMTYLVDTLTWRRAMFVLGISMLVCGIPIAMIVRHHPEEYGYLPDGDKTAPATSKQPPPPVKSTKIGINLKKVVLTRSFWLIALASSYQGLAVGAVTTHVMPYLSSIGIARSVSSLMALVIPLASIGGRLTFGWLGDKYDKRMVAGSCYVMIVLGMLLFAMVPLVGLWLLIPFSLLLGTGWGGCVPLRPVLQREYLGKANFGTILGFVYGAMMVGQIIGSPLAGWFFDSWGVYQGIWYIYAVLGVGAVVSILCLPR